MRVLGIASIILSLLSIGNAFNSFSHSFVRVSPQSVTSRQSSLHMGLFDFLTGGKKKTASASHILVKGSQGPQFLTELKGKLTKSSDLKTAFAEAASKHSACPSGKRGGDLGTFSQGQMVPAFDKVVFNEEIGVVHGPLNTPFGAHLILIDARSDD